MRFGWSRLHYCKLALTTYVLLKAANPSSDSERYLVRFENGIRIISKFLELFQEFFSFVEMGKRFRRRTDGNSNIERDASRCECKWKGWNGERSAVDCPHSLIA
ncbi:hypothetical protein HZH68_001430 [Vespula germanica]|uniref:SWIM-type domain-containing protein n=1 Tax=Vespula germanica TaxID=30212 RepID=A0A834NVH1_VESGE|nr:hypothetical protein HZH68_001430 [Vespula germanica]